ncbi:hypothetical protein IBA8401_01600 [Pseudomonas syringae]
MVIGLIGLYHYLAIKRAEERGRRYDRYHKLLEDLNANALGDAPFIDRQIAVVYEMRNFPEYFSVSLRILNRSLHRWKELSDRSELEAKILSQAVNTLYEEARLTIKFIERKQGEQFYFQVPLEDR